MTRDGLFIILLATGLVYILSGIVMLMRALRARKFMWVWHVLPLFYVGGTFVFICWLILRQVSSATAIALFIWGQLLWGIWVFVVMIQHMRRWDKLKQDAPELLEKVDANF